MIEKGTIIERTDKIEENDDGHRNSLFVKVRRRL
jgi:hypothetical protein